VSISEREFFRRIETLEGVSLELMEKAETTEPTPGDTGIAARDASAVANMPFWSVLLLLFQVLPIPERQRINGLAFLTRQA